jgi:hypothetical protein
LFLFMSPLIKYLLINYNYKYQQKFSSNETIKFDTVKTNSKRSS